MDLETYDQNTIPKEVFGDDILFLKPNTQLTAMFHEGKIVSYDLPKTVDLEGDRHAAGHQGRDRDEPDEGRRAGDGPEDAAFRRSSRSARRFASAPKPAGISAGPDRD